ncbi:unnamed protein product, partial [Prorocentrum cordatum]
MLREPQGAEHARGTTSQSPAGCTGGSSAARERAPEPPPARPACHRGRENAAVDIWARAVALRAASCLIRSFFRFLRSFSLQRWHLDSCIAPRGDSRPPCNGKRRSSTRSSSRRTTETEMRPRAAAVHLPGAGTGAAAAIHDPHSFEFHTTAPPSCRRSHPQPILRTARLAKLAKSL